MSVAGHVLQPGETIEYDELKFVVDRVERRRLLQVALELPHSQPEQKDTESVQAAS
jgi:Mg2+/Co2+ transporter CorC